MVQFVLEFINLTQGKMRNQTTLTVLAMAATLSSGTWAQSSVNISGTIDVGVLRDTTKTWKMGSFSRSNITFSGVEDLGDGLAATFKLQSRFDLDTGALEDAATRAKPFWYGESTVGLKGPFGAVRFGRAMDAMINNSWRFDPWWDMDKVLSPAFLTWNYNFPVEPRAYPSATPGQLVSDYTRLSNGVFYDSPRISGFALHVSTSPERRPGDATRPIGAAVTYERGWLTAMVSHERNADRNRDTFFGLKGSFSGFRLMGAFDRSVAGSSVAYAKSIGLEYDIGNMMIKAGAAHLEVDDKSKVAVGSVSAYYYLSKRTSVHADFSRQKFFPVETRNVYGVGVVHSF